MILIDYDNMKYYLLSIVFTVFCDYSYGQDYIPATIDNPNGATIAWQKDGSVLVIGGPVTFTSGISPPQVSSNPEDQIEASKMVLANEEAYHEDSGIEYGFEVTTSQNGEVPNVKMEVFRRPGISPENINTIGNNFGFDFIDSDYLVYGTQLTDIGTYENWPIFEYKDSRLRPLHQTTVVSNDYTKLWNRPDDRSKWWIVADVFGVVVVIVVVFFAGAFVIGSSAVDALLAAIATAIDGIPAIAAAGITTQTMIAVLSYSALTMVATIGFTMKSISFAESDASSKGFDTQVKFNTYPEVPLPPKVTLTTTEAKIYNEEIDNRLTSSEPCSFDPSLRCVQLPFHAVVVKVEVTDAHLKSISFPGSIFRENTPYQLFDDYYYQSEEEGKIHCTGGNVKKNRGDSKFQNTGELPLYIVEPVGVDQELKLSFINFQGLPYFYLVSKQKPLAFNDYYHINLGKYGDFNGESYDLYRYRASLNENRNPAVNITLGLEGPFLAGDNILIDDTESHDDVTIANEGNQFFFKDAALNEIEDVELTVNGDVLIFDPADKSSQTPLVATGFWQFYVGKKGEAVGIVAENFAITDRSKYFLPDFVFADDYTLTTLAEREQYVKDNKHLPYVPSQKNVNEDGFYSIPHMMFGQLQNLEELYLHAFRQEEEIKQQMARSKALRKRLSVIQGSLEKLENNK